MHVGLLFEHSRLRYCALLSNDCTSHMQNAGYTDDKCVHHHPERLKVCLIVSLLHIFQQTPVVCWPVPDQSALLLLFWKHNSTIHLYRCLRSHEQTGLTVLGLDWSSLIFTTAPNMLNMDLLILEVLHGVINKHIKPFLDFLFKPYTQISEQLNLLNQCSIWQR